jgi:hypothetical protein
MYCLCVDVYCHRVSTQLQLTNIYQYQYQYISLSILMKLGFSKQIFEKFSNINFHENPFSGSRIAS